MNLESNNPGGKTFGEHQMVVFEVKSELSQTNWICTSKDRFLWQTATYQIQPDDFFLGKYHHGVSVFSNKLNRNAENLNYFFQN